MKNYFFVLVVACVCSVVFHACALQRLEVNPGFAQSAGQKPAEIKPSTKSHMSAEKPEWKIGYWWKYAWKQPGKSGIVTAKVVREDVFEGHPSYVVKRGKSEYFYTKDVLGMIAKKVAGKLVDKRDAPRQNFAWPLETGREWRNFYVKEDMADKTSEIFDYRMVVAGVEEVRVPAGTFRCFKTEVHMPYTGTLIAEYWYSPEVKSYVKYKIYAGEGLREGELLSFKVD